MQIYRYGNIQVFVIPFVTLLGERNNLIQARSPTDREDPKVLLFAGIIAIKSSTFSSIP